MIRVNYQSLDFIPSHSPQCENWEDITALPEVLRSKRRQKGFKETTELAHRERLLTLLFHSTQKTCKMCKWCFCFYFEEKMMGILAWFCCSFLSGDLGASLQSLTQQIWWKDAKSRPAPYRCVCNHVQSDILDDFSETDIHERKNWSCLAYRCVTKADSISQLVHLNACWKLSILIQHCCEPPTSGCYQWPVKLFNSCKG